MGNLKTLNLTMLPFDKCLNFQAITIRADLDKIDIHLLVNLEAVTLKINE